MMLKLQWIIFKYVLRSSHCLIFYVNYYKGMTVLFSCINLPNSQIVDTRKKIIAKRMTHLYFPKEFYRLKQ